MKICKHKICMFAPNKRIQNLGRKPSNLPLLYLASLQKTELKCSSNDKLTFSRKSFCTERVIICSVGI